MVGLARARHGVLSKAEARSADIVVIHGRRARSARRPGLAEPTHTLSRGATGLWNKYDHGYLKCKSSSLCINHQLILSKGFVNQKNIVNLRGILIYK